MGMISASESMGEEERWSGTREMERDSGPEPPNRR